jgi:peptidoglycan lytic transglycosylase G
VAEDRRRSSEEREAARREREAGRQARAVKRSPAPAPAPPPRPGAQPRQPAPPPREEPQPQAPEPPRSAEPEPQLAAEVLTYTDEHELDAGGEGEQLEAPAGTRRVTRLSHPPASLKLKAPGSRSPKVSGKRRHSRAGRLFSLVALVLAAGLIWFLIQLFQPFHGSPHGSVRVTIPPGTGSRKVGDLLARDGVLASGFFFELRATLAGERSDLRGGTYRLQLGMSYGSVLKTLTTPPPAARVTELTVTEGRTRHEVDELLRKQGVKGSYLAATRRSRLLNLRAFRAPRDTASLEGFLFPATYQLIEPIRVSALVADQLRTFRQRFSRVNLSYARSRHLTPYDVLIIASLIESETPTSHDRPLVSSVIYNRLANNMPLQLDSTTRFATGNLTKPLTVSQLNSNSPYNTRKRAGLPPTPIDSPGLASIEAAAHPARTRFLYFFARPCSRGSVFASNFTQFLGQERRFSSKHC